MSLIVIPARSSFAAGLLALTIELAPSAHGAQTDEQQDCVNEMNKRG